jgi:FkbM family methyltransferase
MSTEKGIAIEALLKTFEEIEPLLVKEKNENAINMPHTRKAWCCWKLRKYINQALEKMGLHIMSSKRFYDLQRYFSRDPYALASSFQLLEEFIRSSERFEAIYNLLQDDEFKDTFKWFIKYRVAYVCIGNTASMLYPPPIGSSLWERYLKDIEAAKVEKDLYKVGHYVIRCTDPSALLSSWSEEAYKLNGICEPKKGDWIIDGGAFQGDTTLWFSDLVGSEGKVYAFEPLDKNYNVLLENIKRNGLKNVITIPKALYRESKIYSMIGDGQGTTLVENGSCAIEATTIDEFTQSQNCPRIDLIKMDIEGSEVPALEGAISTIKKYLPRLAISVYHNGTDILAAPELIKRVEPNYSLYLRHRSNSWVDTILYAVP